MKAQYQLNTRDRPWRRSAAPSARNVPKGSAYFIPPRRETMRPMPTTEPANDAIINRQERQLPADEGADHGEHLHVAHAEPFLMTDP